MNQPKVSNLKGPPPWNAIATCRLLSHSCLCPTAATNAPILRLLLVPVLAVIPNSTLLVIWIHVLMRQVIPLRREDVLVESPLIPVLPIAPLNAELPSLSVTDEVTAHASMDQTAIVRLERTGYGSLVVS